MAELVSSQIKENWRSLFRRYKILEEPSIQQKYSTKAHCSTIASYSCSNNSHNTKEKNVKETLFIEDLDENLISMSKRGRWKYSHCFEK